MTPEEKQQKKSQKKSRAWLLDPEQTSEFLGISRSSVIRMIVDGQLPAICLRAGKTKKVWRICKEVLEKWVIGKEREQVKRRTSLEQPSAQPSPPLISESAQDDSNPVNGKALD